MLTPEHIIDRNNVNIIGSGDKVIMMAHGFGCNQTMWRFLIPELPDDYKLVLFDYVGSGAASMAEYSTSKYSSLEGYAQDIVDICKVLDLQNVSFIGHSVSGTIGLLATRAIHDRINALIMICPSPCFLNIDPSYQGGFEKHDLSELIELMDKNYIGWAECLAPLVTGITERHPVTNELTESFCTTNPISAKNFAKATFFSDHRTILPENTHPVLLLQSDNDALASLSVGQYMEKHTPGSELQVIKGKGHCLHMTHPQDVALHIKRFLEVTYASE
ncbi:alpha/beta hydrolase [Idiomarina sp. Sol25]|uniref:alpha/beta fold hydrolase n=1 Tax=Idiomarina sp. Sol25 TaxID=3064000 RepID=UPI00294A9DF2|nr:alpha/beta hydrolase [Idiomarina sp. Sol25]MDV6326886.1 alpha/beta hydrolase [Idiomarina sp. Sol25]